jgi:lysozyme
MQLSEKGAAFVRLHEGYAAKYYLDPVKVGTIGIGFTWGSAAFREWWGKNNPGVTFGPGATMTRAEAEDALRYLFEREYGKAVNDFLKKTVPQHVFDGMASPVFNLGPGSLKWKWATVIRAGDLAKGAALLRTTGTTAKGKKLAGLVRRRKEEALLIELGIYTGVDNASGLTVPLADADGILIRRERGPAVAQLIRDLHKLGYYDGRLDDVFGPGTESAVLAFQRMNGLEDDGKVGPATRAALDRALAALEKVTGPSASPATPPSAVPIQQAPVSAAPKPAPPATGLITLLAIAASSIAAYFGWGS